MVTRAEAEAREIFQRVRDVFELEELTYDPPRPHEFFVNSLFTRTLGYLVGWFGKIPRLLQCTSAGILKTAPTTTGFEKNDTKAGTAPDSYGAAIAFDTIVSRVDIFIWDNPAMVKRSPDGIIWHDEFEVPAGTMYSFDCVTHSFNIRNKSAGLVARYSVIGWS